MQFLAKKWLSGAAPKEMKSWKISSPNGLFFFIMKKSIESGQFVNETFGKCLKTCTEGLKIKMENYWNILTSVPHTLNLYMWNAHDMLDCMMPTICLGDERKKVVKQV